MPTKRFPRSGSLQIWPRKRADKFLPSVNWNAINSKFKNNLKGFIGYKAGMTSVLVKDNTSTSMTKGKKIILPATIIECPPMKIFSVRFYKNGKVFKEILAKNLEKELKRKIKIPKKEQEKKIEDVKDYEDVRIIVYSLVKKTGIKKTPDLSEIGLGGTLDEKINFIKENLSKEISMEDFLEKEQLVDVRGLTKGKGWQGSVKRFGIGLKSHKAEKGQRGPGTLGPWHPARVTFHAPQAGQMGFFTRVTYNNKVISFGKENKELKNISHYGDIKTNYLLIQGSVQGPQKRQLLITSPLRITKKQQRKSYEVIGLRR